MLTSNVPTEPDLHTLLSAQLCSCAVQCNTHLSSCWQKSAALPGACDLSRPATALRWAMQ